MKKKIIYIPDYYYLSHPIFFNIAKSAKGKFHNIYFNTKDPQFAKTNREGIKVEEIKKYFDEYYEINESLIPIEEESGDKLKNFFEMIKYQWRIRKEINHRLDLLKPDAIFTTSDMGGFINRMSNDWAEKNNVPFIIIQSAFLEEKPGRISIKNKVKYIFFNKIFQLPLYRKQKKIGNEKPTNHLILWSKYFGKQYKGTSIERNIYFGGHPAFDNILKKDIHTDLINLKLPVNKPIVTICTQIWNNLLAENIIEDINNIFISGIKNNQDFFFVINVHRRQNIRDVKEIFESVNTKNYLIVKYPDIFPLLLNSNIQVSVSSTISFESVVLGIPIILVKKDCVTSFDYFKNEIELRANTPKEFDNHLKLCLDPNYLEEFKKRRYKYLKKMLGDLNGKSSEKILNILEEKIWKY